jgi:hypothetical protein
MEMKELMAAFVSLSPEDKTAFRAAIAKQAEGAESCCSGAEKDELKGLFAQMEASGNPMAMCSEMMQMCQQKMAKVCSS